jgi:hypothetical protein
MFGSPAHGAQCFTALIHGPELFSDERVILCELKDIAWSISASIRADNELRVAKPDSDSPAAHGGIGVVSRS